MPLIIDRGITARPFSVCLYGPPKIGKTTWAAQAPGVLFLRTEDRLDHIDADKLPLCKSWRDVIDQLGQVAKEDHEYKTLAFDSLTSAERLLHEHVARAANRATVAEIDYGKGYVAAVNEFRRVLDAFTFLRDKRAMNIIAIGHSAVEKQENPGESSFDRYMLDLNKHARALVQQSFDNLFLAVEEVKTVEEKAAFGKKNRAVGRVVKMIVSSTPRAVAGNSLSIQDEEAPFSFDWFAKAHRAFYAQSPTHERSHDNG
jgi:hypothetical protein